MSAKRRPGRTGRLPTRNPHRPGRAQLRHPVPLVKVSLSSCSLTRFAIRCRHVYMPFWISVHPISIFPSNDSSSRCGPSHLYRAGFLRSRFPCLRYYDHTTTALCPSHSFISLSRGTGRSALLSCCSRLFTPRAGEKPGLLISRLIRRRFLASRDIEPSHVPV